MSFPTSQVSLNQANNKQQLREDRKVQAEMLSKQPATPRKARTRVRTSTKDGILTINSIRLSESSTEGLRGFLIGTHCIA
jgi:hypothetical protein